MYSLKKVANVLQDRNKDVKMKLFLSSQSSPRYDQFVFAAIYRLLCVIYLKLSRLAATGNEIL